MHRYIPRRRPGRPEQIAYAAADVEVLMELEARMRTRLPLFEVRNE